MSTSRTPHAALRTVRRRLCSCIDPKAVYLRGRGLGATAFATATKTSDFSINGEAFSVALSGNGISGGLSGESVPTLSAWGLMLLCGVLALFGVLSLRGGTAIP